MTPALESLARRAVACPRWRWMPGMLTFPPEHPRGDDYFWTFCIRLHDYDEGEGDARPPEDYLPDLSDPATLGGFLALIQEIADTIPDPPEQVPYHPMVYRLGDVYRALMTCGLVHTETAAALISALESAP